MKGVTMFFRKGLWPTEELNLIGCFIYSGLLGFGYAFFSLPPGKGIILVWAVGAAMAILGSVGFCFSAHEAWRSIAGRMRKLCGWFFIALGLFFIMAMAIAYSLERAGVIQRLLEVGIIWGILQLIAGLLLALAPLPKNK